MAWDLDRQELNHAQGMHIMHLHNPATKPIAEHKLQINLKAATCPCCGHVVPKDNVGEIDPQAHLEAELAALNESHAAAVKYQAKHRIPSSK